MRYTKPNVVETHNAALTIQNHSGDGAKLQQIRPDNMVVPSSRSTTGAYDADE